MISEEGSKMDYQHVQTWYVSVWMIFSNTKHLSNVEFVRKSNTSYIWLACLWTSLYIQLFKIDMHIEK